ncbi:major facilitator superfamily domain-containing protein [Lentinula edodes]|nr:major facilitator superfamily domain-containing protein [Lentinula edodes]
MAKSVQSTDSARDTKDATESSSIGSYRSSGGHYVTVGEDPAMEKKVWRKIDTYVLPIVAMFYLLSFLDRTNVGNARVAGLQTGLKMTNKQYSIALTVTYVPYIVAELPSNLMLKAVGPNLMLPTMLTLWGIVSTLQGIVKSYSGLLACRFFLGLCEGGVFPGLVLYLSYFYPRYKMNLRVSTFFSSASVSGAFSGILAYAIIHMEGIGNRPGWAWIFILEGLFTVLFGLSSYFTLPRSVDTAWFLTAEEKRYVNAKLLEDNAHTDEEESFSWKEVLEATKLPQVWFLAIAFFLDGVVLYSLAYFAPSIIQGLGYTAAKAQLMTVPPFAVGFVVAMISAFISDRYQCRGLIVIVSSLFCVIGFAMFLGSRSHHIQYGSLFFSIPGTYTTAPTLSAWSSNNAAPQTRRATAIAIGFIMTNSGGILATWLLGSLSPAPEYTSATITLLVFSLFMAIFGAINLGYLWSQNKKKAENRRRTTVEQEKEEKSGLGDRSAWFVYNL